MANTAAQLVDRVLSVLAKWPGDGSIRSVLVAFAARRRRGVDEVVVQGGCARVHVRYGHAAHVLACPAEFIGVR
jgi:hypothetical protein